MNEVQYIFEQDIKDKKRIGTGVFSKTGKKGYVGKMRTPYDLMSAQEKRQLNTNKVVTYSVYDTIMSYDDFKTLDELERTRILAEYLKRFSRKKISEEWGVKPYSVNNWVSQLGLSQPRQTPKTNSHRKEDEPAAGNEGFSIKLVGSFNGKEIQDRLMALAQILIDDRAYSITFVINENDNN
ncbi:helix-turn-helix domain-containing protein [Metallumcola ferriviriculae]|uniref:Helix-turn-helix domain-containing protein n=1 Tax=Metallumcola ferriviriculae TaxID=3039180 RepID=A0AAU0UTW0_9FIRM|nr:helix-turn-helix domain-containing protein [Desulfitibacteraceae bacterium MK1]